MVNFRNSGSEVEASSKLNLPRVVNKVAVGVGGRPEQWRKGRCRCGGSDVKAKARACGRARSYAAGGQRNRPGGLGDVRCGVNSGHILLVGQIEEIREDFHFVSFRDGEALGNTQVSDPCDGLTERVATDVNPVGTTRTVDAAQGPARCVAGSKRGVGIARLDLIDGRKLPSFNQLFGPSSALPR